jgi:hypothetical protein
MYTNEVNTPPSVSISILNIVFTSTAY